MVEYIPETNEVVISKNDYLRLDIINILVK